MMREEFDRIYEAIADALPVLTNDEYECIEFVYNWHPCNFSKEAIASLYHEFGMCIIYDLLLRANMAMEHDQAIERARTAVTKATENLTALKDKNIKTKEVLQEWLEEQY